MIPRGLSWAGRRRAPVGAPLPEGPNLAALAAPLPAEAGRPARRVAIRSAADRSLRASREAPFGPPAEGSLLTEILTLRDALVTPRGFVVAGGDLLWDTAYIAPGWVRGEGSPAIPDVMRFNGLGALRPDRGDMLFRPPPDVVRVPGRFFLFNSEAATGNFGHLWLDTLPQMPAFRAVSEAAPGIRPLFVGGPFRFEPMRWLIARLLGPEAAAGALSTGHHFLRFETLLVPTPHLDLPAGRVAGEAIRRLREMVAEALAPLPAGPPEKLFVSRSDSTRGATGTEPRIRDEEALLALAASRGFRTVVASRLPVPRYFELFKNAGCLLGLHGAGLFNVLLAEGGRLIELEVPGPTPWHLRGLQLLCDAAGLPHRRIRPAAVDGFEAGFALGEIESAIDALA